MTAAAVHAPTLAAGRVPEFRYGIVMLIVLVSLGVLRALPTSTRQ